MLVSRKVGVTGVSPRVGEWIEIQIVGLIDQMLYVSPRVGEWIEIGMQT